MNKHRLFLLLCASALTTGCMVGPDYKAPTAQMPEKWRNENTAPDREVDLSRWWKQFGDPVLDSLMERAFAGNIDLAILRSRIDQARFTLGMTRSGLFPAVDANGGFSESQQGSGPTGPNYSIGAAASWEIDVFGGVRREVQATVADYYSAQADKCAGMVSLSAEVAQDYFLYRAIQQELVITQSNLETQKRTLGVTEMLRSSEFVSNLDVVRAQADVQSTLAEIPSLERQLEQARHALEYLLGLPTGSLSQELESAGVFVDLGKFVPEAGVPAALVQRRPDIIVAEYKIRAATARIGAAQADFYPHFYVTGDVKYSAGNVNQLFTAAARSWNIGPTVTWNIFSAGKTVYNVKLQKAITEEAGLSWNAAVLTAIKEVEDALVGIGKERERMQTLGELVKSQRAAFALSNNLYKAGQIEFLDLLVAQRSMLTSEQSEVKSRRELISYMIGLYKALGGGWSEDDLKNNEDPKDGPVPGVVDAPNA